MDILGTTTAANRGSRYSNISADFIKNSLLPLDFYRHKLLNAPISALCERLGVCYDS
jgi:hypothetical protein